MLLCFFFFPTVFIAYFIILFFFSIKNEQIYLSIQIDDTGERTVFKAGLPTLNIANCCAYQVDNRKLECAKLSHVGGSCQCGES